MTKAQKNSSTLFGLPKWVKGLLKLQRWSKPESIPSRMATIATAELKSQENDMPRVDGVRYPYTKSGKAAAKKYAKKTGKTVAMMQKRNKARKRK